MTMPKIYKLREIASYAGLSTQSVRRHIKTHKLSHFRIGGNREIGMTEEQIESMMSHVSQLIVGQK